MSHPPCERHAETCHTLLENQQGIRKLRAVVRRRAGSLGWPVGRDCAESSYSFNSITVSFVVVGFWQLGRRRDSLPLISKDSKL